MGQSELKNRPKLPNNARLLATAIGLVAGKQPGHSFRRCFHGYPTMNRFSIVIPITRDNPQNNEIQRFEDTLASVLRSRPEQSQIVIVHDGHYEDPHGLGAEVDWVVETSPQLTSQFDMGVSACQGELITLIRPGIELDEGWEHAIGAAFEDPQVGSLTPLIVPISQPTRIATAGVTMKTNGTRQLLGSQQRLAPRTLRRLKPLGPSSHLAVYRRSAINAIGELACLTESVYLDIEVALSLRALGFSNVLCADTVATTDSEHKILTESSCPHGCTAERALYRYGQRGTSAPWLRTVTDILSATINPWRLRHGFQRLAARRQRSADQSFRRHLEVVKHTESWSETTIHPESTLSDQRRAA